MMRRRFPLSAALAATVLAMGGGAFAQQAGPGASTTPTGGELGVSPTTGVPDAPRRDTSRPAVPTQATRDMSDAARADAAPTPPAPALPSVPPTPGAGTGDLSPGSASPSTSSRTADAAGPGGVEILAEIGDPEVAVGGGAAGPARTARMQTMLLNRFGQLGFGEVREFRREGDTYVTEALSKNGDWVTVVLDPVTGTIAARR